ncbi:desmoglein-2-like [Amblyraja radiata]|uniref:desmoglein-2-like n=1 Tax=Amblyraja radiata TaxID=386614 RepID=UPI001403365A|nr:desmoglein-2-like [Amblyraja radiata]
MPGTPWSRRAALASLTLLLTYCGVVRCNCQRHFTRSKVEALLAPQVTKGQAVLTVPFRDCGLGENIRWSTSNGDFEVHNDGSIFATRTQLIKAKRGLKVRAADLDTGETWTVDVLLIPSRRERARRNIQVIRFPSKRPVVRQKREWVSPPIGIREHEPPIVNPIAMIRSDFEDKEGVEITYSITGPGADKLPMGLFVIDSRTGDLNVTGTVDRELNPSFLLTGYAVDQFGKAMENPIGLFVEVIDINDNPPIFTQEIFFGSVEEMSFTGTSVMQINATDKDIGENAIIHYRVIVDKMKQMFSSSFTGDIRVTDPQLDRETQDFYTLIVEARDRAGNIEGLHSTATVQVKIMDVNDNVPTVEQHTYEVTLEENRIYFEALLMKVQDADLEFTDNWLGHFEIIEGNENKHFRIEMNNQTNEGILILQKELNFEEMEHMNLVCRVSNKAPYHHTVDTTMMKQSFEIKVIIRNMAEGFVFKPSRLETTMTESSSSGRTTQVIGIYTAVSADTGERSESTKYAKDSDKANWLIINTDTGEVTFDGELDRESEYVINGTYTATVLAITQERDSYDTSTGTIVINVDDVNDHTPSFENTQPCICSSAKYLRVAASDPDRPPFGAPFHFDVPTNKMWKLGRTDATSMELVPQQDLYPGLFTVPVWVEDNGGNGHLVNLDIKVSECFGVTRCLTERLIQSKAVLGSSAIALIIFTLFLLLLLPLLLLLFCQCGGGGLGGPKGLVLAEKDGGFGTLGQSDFEGGGQVDTMIPLIARSGEHEVAGLHGEWIATGSQAGGAVGASGGAVRASGGGVGASGGGVRASGGGVGASGGGVGASGGGVRASGTHITESIHERTSFYDRTGWSMGQEAGLGRGHSMSIRGQGRSTRYRGQHQTGIHGGEAEAFSMTGGALKAYVNQCIDQRLLAVDQEWARQASCDSLRVFHNEGSDSNDGLLECCSLVEEDPFDDSFLNNLDLKFKTLAGICSGRLSSDTSEVVTSGHWQLETSPRPLPQQEAAVGEVAVGEEVAWSSVTRERVQHAGNPLPMKKHYVVTTTIEPSTEDLQVVHDLSRVASQHEGFQRVSASSDSTVDYSAGQFQGGVHSSTVPVLQKNVVVPRSFSIGSGGAQGVTAVPSAGHLVSHNTRVVTSSATVGSGGMLDMLVGPVLGSHESASITRSGWREALDPSLVNEQAIEKNVTIGKSNSGMYKSVKKTTKLVQLVQE